MIYKVAKKLKLNKNDIITYGNDMAKIISKPNKINKKNKLILVTSITPTKDGEGKTTLVIGINDALRKLGKNSVAVLREPSMGPTFGLKGGATGGGMATVIPEEEINLSFTGDFNAITNANNLICALIDNHIFQGNKLNIDINTIPFHRCLDVCDRSLRSITLENRNETFDITAASEIMGIMTLCKDSNDLKERIDRIIIGYNNDIPIYLKELNATNAIYSILKNALYPNIVRSKENNPVIIHMGPFANISIGCNSLISTKLATNISDYTIVEAGFGSDLGAEKFFDIKCRIGNLNPSLAIINVTIKALKNHGNGDLKNGFSNLKKHIDNVKNFIEPFVVLNKFENDKIEDITELQNYVNSLNIPFEICESYLKGSIGAINLANRIINHTNNQELKYLYELEDEIKNKIDIICKKMYHVNKVIYTKQVLEKIKNIKKIGFNNLPICIAKSPLTLNGNKDLNLDYIEITDIKVNNGAGYIVVYSGNILTMPGLPENPKACNYKSVG